MRKATLEAVIDTVYPLDQIAEAMRRIAHREVFGKFIITPGSGT